jgi:hypothetical protein
MTADSNRPDALRMTAVWHMANKGSGHWAIEVAKAAIGAGPTRCSQGKSLPHDPCSNFQCTAGCYKNLKESQQIGKTIILLS